MNSEQINTLLNMIKQARSEVRGLISDGNGIRALALANLQRIHDFATYTRLPNAEKVIASESVKKQYARDAVELGLTCDISVNFYKGEWSVVSDQVCGSSGRFRRRRAYAHLQQLPEEMVEFLEKLVSHRHHFTLSIQQTLTAKEAEMQKVAILRLSNMNREEYVHYFLNNAHAVLRTSREIDILKEKVELYPEIAGRLFGIMVDKNVHRHPADGFTVQVAMIKKFTLQDYIRNCRHCFFNIDCAIVATDLLNHYKSPDAESAYREAVELTSKSGSDFDVMGKLISSFTSAAIRRMAWLFQLAHEKCFIRDALLKHPRSHDFQDELIALIKTSSCAVKLVRNLRRPNDRLREHVSRVIMASDSSSARSVLDKYSDWKVDNNVDK